MAYGVATWAANGVYNNYGIKPISVLGIISLADGQKSGSYSFTVEPGLKVGFTIGTQDATGAISYTNKRTIIASGNTIVIQEGSGTDGINVYPAIATQVIVFAEKA